MTTKAKVVVWKSMPSWRYVENREEKTENWQRENKRRSEQVLYWQDYITNVLAHRSTRTIIDNHQQMFLAKLYGWRGANETTKMADETGAKIKIVDLDRNKRIYDRYTWLQKEWNGHFLYRQLKQAAEMGTTGFWHTPNIKKKNIFKFYFPYHRQKATVHP